CPTTPVYEGLRRRAPVHRRAPLRWLRGVLGCGEACWRQGSDRCQGSDRRPGAHLRPIFRRPTAGPGAGGLAPCVPPIHFVRSHSIRARPIGLIHINPSEAPDPYMAPPARGSGTDMVGETCPAQRLRGPRAGAPRPRPRPGPRSPVHFHSMHQARFATAAMGTRFELVLFSAEPQHRAAAEAAIDEIEAAHRRYTRFAPDSLVSYINRTAALAPVHLDADTFAMLEDALHVHRTSPGAFRATTPPPPPPSPRPGFALNPEDRSVTLLHREATIDLGAIAKGH